MRMEEGCCQSEPIRTLDVFVLDQNAILNIGNRREVAGSAAAPSRRGILELVR